MEVILSNKHYKLLSRPPRSLLRKNPKIGPLASRRASCFHLLWVERHQRQTKDNRFAKHAVHYLNSTLTLTLQFPIIYHNHTTQQQYIINTYTNTTTTSWQPPSKQLIELEDRVIQETQFDFNYPHTHPTVHTQPHPHIHHLQTTTS